MSYYDTAGRPAQAQTPQPSRRPATATGLDLESILKDERPRRGRPKRYSEERRKEQQSRSMEYRRLALSALQRLYQDDYAVLFAQAREKVDTERGPLPD